MIGIVIGVMLFLGSALSIIFGMGMGNEGMMWSGFAGLLSSCLYVMLGQIVQLLQALLEQNKTRSPAAVVKKWIVTGNETEGGLKRELAFRATSEAEVRQASLSCGVTPVRIRMADDDGA